MNIVLSWLAVAGTAVLLVAVTVAWWEHRRRVTSRRKEQAWFDTEVNVIAMAGATELDIRLDQPHGSRSERLDLSDEEREQATRQAVLAAALNRMARHKAAADQGDAWADTQPLVNAGVMVPTTSRAHTAGD